ncbi:MAG: class I SAM-dependent methyltransferase [bacterium]
MFQRDGQFFRQINRAGQEDFQAFQENPLSRLLIEQELMLPYQVVNGPPADSDLAYCVIKPQQIKFISYPYEWSWGMLRDAALTTLKIQLLALDHDFSLKDASAFNIQFQSGRPVLIDHLSFTKYRSGRPWIAYRQFCEQFLAPLALMSYRGTRLGQLLRLYPDGLPLDLATKLLPAKARLSLGLNLHLYLHARNQKTHADKGASTTNKQLTKDRLIALIANLKTVVEKLKLDSDKSFWSDYYQMTNYSDLAFQAKQEIVRDYLKKTKGQTVLDLGSNTGVFSELAADLGMETIALDNDSDSVERLYRRVRDNNRTNLLPLVINLTNPSPGLGWANTERESFIDRARSDVVLALALIHHLCIGKNISLEMFSQLLSQLGHWAIVEFVPKSDSQVQRLLRAREDIFKDYHLASFEKAIASRWLIQKQSQVADSERFIYLLKKKHD